MASLMKKCTEKKEEKRKELKKGAKENLLCKTY